MADKGKTLKSYQRNFILVDIKGKAEFIYATLEEIADKLGISESLCYEAKNKQKRLKTHKKSYIIKNYRE